MASNVYTGRSGSLYVTVSSSGGYARLGGLRDWAFAVEPNHIEVVHKDTSGWTETIAGDGKSWGMSCGTVFLSTAASINAQNTIRAAVKSGTRSYWRLYPSTAASTNGTDQTFYAGAGYPVGWTWGGNVGAPQLHGFTAAGDGAYEEQSTNWLAEPLDLSSTSSWDRAFQLAAPANSTVTDPDGNTNAWRMVSTGGGAIVRQAQNLWNPSPPFTGAIPPAAQAAVSVSAKWTSGNSTNGSVITLQDTLGVNLLHLHWAFASSGATPSVTLAIGSTVSGTTASVTNQGSGWWRITAYTTYRADSTGYDNGRFNLSAVQTASSSFAVGAALFYKPTLGV